LINLGRVSVVRAGVVSADTSLDEERNKASLNVYHRDEALSPARREAAATLDVIYELLGRAVCRKE
jgi:hypothetical protein